MGIVIATAEVVEEELDGGLGEMNDVWGFINRRQLTL